MSGRYFSICDFFPSLLFCRRQKSNEGVRNRRILRIVYIGLWHVQSLKCKKPVNIYAIIFFKDFRCFPTFFQCVFNDFQCFSTIFNVSQSFAISTIRSSKLSLASRHQISAICYAQTMRIYIKGARPQSPNKNDLIKNQETNHLMKKFIISVHFHIILNISTYIKYDQLNDGKSKPSKKN